MPKYQYRYSLMRVGFVEAKDIADAAIQARKFIAGMPDAKLHDVTRVEPPVEENAIKPDAG